MKTIIPLTAYSFTSTVVEHTTNVIEENLLSDYKFWFGSVAVLISLTSLILSLKSNSRSKRTEKRILMEDKAKSDAALCLYLCETAASNSIEIPDKSHPEWKALSRRLLIGEAHEMTFSSLYVDAYYLTLPLTAQQKTIEVTWNKWYIGIGKLEKPLHIYAVFGELPKLLKRPGKLSFEIDNSVPLWVKKIYSDKEIIVGILFCETTVL
jgi:hypothetical protein